MQCELCFDSKSTGCCRSTEDGWEVGERGVQGKFLGVGDVYKNTSLRQNLLAHVKVLFNQLMKE